MTCHRGHGIAGSFVYIKSFHINAGFFRAGIKYLTLFVIDISQRLPLFPGIVANSNSCYYKRGNDDMGLTDNRLPVTGRINIRQADPDDLPRILEIEHLCFPPGMAYPPDLFCYYLTEPRHLTLVALSGPHLAGFIVAGENGGSAAWIVTLDVHPGARRQGIGTQLVRAVEARYARAGVHRLSLQVGVGNAGAVSLYEKAGFRKTDDLADYYGPGQDAFIMEKKIAASAGD
jgi:ribosomal-protein-alanine N-acetyltransferase